MQQLSILCMTIFVCVRLPVQERRMNYTAELEGKIEGLSEEADRLSSRLHSLNKQDAKLRASKNELEQQVGLTDVGS